MRHKDGIPLFCMLLCVSAALCQEPPRTPQQLVERSRKVSDLSDIGPYRLHATVLFRLFVKEMTGDLTLFCDKDRLRSELQIGAYRETRWINNNTLYIDRTQPAPLPKATLLRRIDHLWRANLIPSGAKTSPVFRHKLHGKELNCFETKESSGKRKSCFDPSTSMLVSEDAGFDFHDLEFKNFSSIGEKFFPQEIILSEEGRVLVEVKEISVTKADPPLDTFDATAASLRLATCDEPTPPHVVKEVPPQIPKDELSEMREAKVYLYGIVGIDGTIQNLEVEYSSHPSFTASAISALKQSRYAPATCGNNAVPAETEVYILYSRHP